MIDIKPIPGGKERTIDPLSRPRGLAQRPRTAPRLYLFRLDTWNWVMLRTISRYYIASSLQQAQAMNENERRITYSDRRWTTIGVVSEGYIGETDVEGNIYKM